MKQLKLFAPNDLRIVEAEKPEPGKGEALVRVKACAICTLEQRLFRGSMRIYYPIVPGHEAAGEVVEVGPGSITDLKPGEKVALDLIYRCGECYWCRVGQSNHCAFRFSKDVQTLGGFSEYIVVKTKQCFKVSGSVPFEIAALSEPLSCCVHSLRAINIELGEDLLVVGAGTMGLIHVLLAKTMGTRVFVVDPIKSRLDKAVALGADFPITFNPEEMKNEVLKHTDGRGVDAAIITAPTEEAFRNAAKVVRKGGRLAVYSAYSEEFDIPVNANYLHRSEISVVGVEGRSEKDFLIATKILSNGLIDLSPLVSSVFGPEQATAAIEKAGKPESYRVVLDFSK
ncbi:MAG: alcohol dehydrogenase catalytic domain-containing protein [Caldiserica bacterium]|jgi:L-iditol 2-dehydrogenase|nr:alcohol dehydrogenase catalytic domain-containing protein [Caldisericota bacterium]